VAAGRRERQGILSVETAGRVLRALADAREPLMLRDVAARAGMPAAKAHRYLVSLSRLGLVEQHLANGRYDLGQFALEIGLAALARLDPVTVAGRRLEGLARETGETVAIAVWGNRGPVIVRWWGADTPVAATARVGAVMPLTRSATGRAFHAFLPRETTADLLAAELRANRRAGLEPDSAAEVERIAARTARAGHAFTSEFIPGISGIAVPVRDANGMMVLALIALGYTKPFTARRELIVAATMRTAGEISARLGAPAA
jgi:DNA-binding IclR family transcriptional regulator